VREHGHNGHDGIDGKRSAGVRHEEDDGEAHIHVESDKERESHSKLRKSKRIGSVGRDITSRRCWFGLCLALSTASLARSQRHHTFVL